MSLRFYNTLHRQLEDFTPLHAPEVGLYTCGPTVYWSAHIGNFRSYVFEDVLQRVLEMEGFLVKRVMNITDVGELADNGEDKMLLGAKREGKTVQEVAQMYLDRFLRDAERLNIKIPKPPFLCKATEHIFQQIELIQVLEQRGFTYQTDDGVYFDTAKFSAYGSFSGQKLEDKEAGARVAINDQKRNATDFALWKFAPLDAERQLWESPWGTGFPGWHVECSAMARLYLGQPFDIHCGGVDHIPVHHENEIAQSEAAYGVPLANYWLHNEFVLVDDKKMSKSLGNVYTIDDLAARGFDPLAYRYFCLNAQYRSKINFTWQALEGAAQGLKHVQAVARTSTRGTHTDQDVYEKFCQALEDDLNTPRALAVMWDFLKSDVSSDVKGATLLKMDEVLGLGLDAIVGRLIEAPAELRQLAQERQVAREAKDFARADALRKEIEQRGWTVLDGSDGAWTLVAS